MIVVPKGCRCTSAQHCSGNVWSIIKSQTGTVRAIPPMLDWSLVFQAAQSHMDCENIDGCITAIFSCGFESNAVLDILQTIPSSLKVLLKQALAHFKIQNETCVHYPDFSIANFSPRTPEDDAEDIRNSEISVFGHWEIQPAYGYVQILVPRNTFAPKQIMFNKRLVDIFAISSLIL